MTDKALGAKAPPALAKARIELHWLAQVLAATGDAFLDRADDDSQSNGAWDPKHSALVGRPIGNGARIGLSIAKAELLMIASDGSVAAHIDCRGKTLAELLSWSGEAMSETSGAMANGPLKTRDYDMPEHQVSAGQPFAFEDTDALAELARWFERATDWLAGARSLDPRAGEVRCWPHHFDIGGIFMLEPDKPFEEARQMGIGWSPGDSTYQEPYFYVTPFPVPSKLPELPLGHWHREGFTGAILTGTDVTSAADAESQSERVQEFLRSAIQQTLPLITD